MLMIIKVHFALRILIEARASGWFHSLAGRLFSWRFLACVRFYRLSPYRAMECECCNSLGSSPKFQLLLNVSVVILFILLGVYGIATINVSNYEFNDPDDWDGWEDVASFWVTSNDLAYWFGLIVPGRFFGTLSLRCILGLGTRYDTTDYSEWFSSLCLGISCFHIRVKHLRIEGSTSPTEGILENYGTFVLRSLCCGWLSFVPVAAHHAVATWETSNAHASLARCFICLMCPSL